MDASGGGKVLMDDNEPYKGLKLDLLDLIGVEDQRMLGTLTDFQVGQLVRQHVHGLKVDAEKFKNALGHKVQRSKGCKVCFYTGFQMSFSGFGTQLDPSHQCTYCQKDTDKTKSGPVCDHDSCLAWHCSLSSKEDTDA